MTNRDDNGGLVKKSDAQSKQVRMEPSIYPTVIAPRITIGAIKQNESLKLQVDGYGE